VVHTSYLCTIRVIHFSVNNHLDKIKAPASAGAFSMLPDLLTLYEHIELLFLLPNR
jgi:hypothetical protein